MTVGFRIRRKTDHQWWRQVDRRRPVNTDSPLLQGAGGIWMALPWLAGTSTFYDLLGRRHGASVNGPVWVATGRGPMLQHDGADDYTTLITTAPTGMPALTVAWYGSINTAETFARIFTNLLDGTAANLWFLAQSASVAGRPRFVVANTAATVYTAEETTTMTSGVPGLLVGSADATNVRLAMNDRAVRTTAVGGTISLGMATSVRLACSSTVSPANCCAMSTGLAMIWPGIAIPDAMRLALYEQSRRGWTSGPDAILRTQSTRRYSFGAMSGGSPPAATLFRRSLQSRIGSRGAA